MIFESAELPGYSNLSRHGSLIPSDVRVGVQRSRKQSPSHFTSCRLVQNFGFGNKGEEEERNARTLCTSG